MAAYVGSLLVRNDLRFDDAFMYVRYADHLLAGCGHAWNCGGPQTYGSTSLLHEGLVTALRAALPADAQAVLRVASGLAGLAFGALLLGAARRHAPALGRHPGVLAGVLVPLALLNGLVLAHAATGMDTLLGAATVVLVAAAGLAARGGASVAPAVLAAWLAFLARPDMGLVAALTPALLLLGAPRRAGAFLGGFAAVLLVDTALKAWWFGDPLPLPLRAKSPGYYAGYAATEAWNPVSDHADFLAAAWAGLALVALLGRRRDAPVIAALLVPAGLTALWTLRTVPIMGADARFLTPLLGLVLLAGVIVVDGAVAAPPSPRRLAVGAVIAALVAVSPPLVGQASKLWARAVLRPVGVVENPELAPADRPPLPELGWWGSFVALARVGEALPPGATMTATEHGWLGARLPDVTIVDLTGLHDPWFAHHGFDADHLFADPPDLLVMPHPAYTRQVRAILDHPVFRARYDFYPGAFQWGVGILRDGPRADGVRRAVAEAWALTYPDVPMEDLRTCGGRPCSP